MASTESKYPFKNEWTNEKKGLRKELISFKYHSVTKANDLSKCCVTISEITGLKDHHDSEYLRGEHENEYWIKLGDALTPIDCYVEILLKQMLIGETSRCFMRTKSSECISFVVKLIRIEFGGYLYSKSSSEIVALAQHYKENGVKMFKKYPLFAHDYFNKAAKCLISCLPFDTLNERMPGPENLKPEKLQELLENIFMNVAACLNKEKRFEESLHVLEFTERTENIPDKAIYRRAQAHFHIGQLDEAKTVLERINYKDNNECNSLYMNIIEKWKVSNQNYTDMVKKMFG